MVRVALQSDAAMLRPEFTYSSIDNRKTIERAAKIAFIGSCMIFSDRLMRLVESEFEDMQVLRLRGVEDLFLIDTPNGGPIELVVVEDGQIDALEAARSGTVPVARDARWILAYRSPEDARRLVDSARHGRPIGFLPMKAPIDAWLAALRLLSMGEDFLPGELVGAPADAPGGSSSSEGDRDPAGNEPSAVPPTPLPGLDRLTAREVEILDHLARGRRNKAIARELGLSEHTVKLHIHHIFGKLGVRNRTSATHWYLSRRSGFGAAESQP